MTKMPFIDENGVLHDESALAIVKVVKRENCRRMLHDHHADRVRHFAGRIAELGRSPQDVVIVVINVDDQIGAPLAEALMPGHDWSAIRATGQVPYARGLAGRSGIQELLDAIDPGQGDRLRAIDAVAVVMIDRGVVFVTTVGAVFGARNASLP